MRKGLPIKTTIQKMYRLGRENVISDQAWVMVQNSLVWGCQIEEPKMFILLNLGKTDERRWWRGLRG